MLPGVRVQLDTRAEEEGEEGARYGTGRGDAGEVAQGEAA